jgi:hypothetical protein
VTDESSPPDLRWLIERIDRNHRETTTSIAKLEAQLATFAATFDRYVLMRVYEAERDADRARIKRLEDDDTSKSTGNRNWLLSLSQTVVGVVLGLAAGILTKGSH